MTHFYLKCGALRYWNIIRELDSFVQGLEEKGQERKERNRKKMCPFKFWNMEILYSCHDYDIFVHRNSVTLLCDGEIPETSKGEIRDIFRIIFGGSKVRGFINELPSSGWVKEMVKDFPAIHYVPLVLESKGDKYARYAEKLETCLEFVRSLETDAENREDRETVCDILQELISEFKTGKGTE